MRIRRIIITKNSNIADVEALPRQKTVRKCWRLPHEYTLFEFYHPVYDRIYDDDPKVSSAARLDASVRVQTFEAVEQERALMAPLYREMSTTSDATTLMVHSKTVMYCFLGRGKGRVQWPQLGHSLDWEVNQRIRVTGWLSSVVSETVDELAETFRGWSDCMTAAGELSYADTISFSDDHFSAEYEFTNSCGDATMALFMLLTETRYLTALEAVGFFLSHDFTTPFQQIGGRGKSHQKAKLP